jgi:hypothetical protein
MPSLSSLHLLASLAIGNLNAATDSVIDTDLSSSTSTLPGAVSGSLRSDGHDQSTTTASSTTSQRPRRKGKVNERLDQVCDDSDLMEHINLFNVIFRYAEHRTLITPNDFNPDLPLFLLDSLDEDSDSFPCSSPILTSISKNPNAMDQFVSHLIDASDATIQSLKITKSTSSSTSIASSKSKSKSKSKSNPTHASSSSQNKANKNKTINPVASATIESGDVEYDHLRSSMQQVCIHSSHNSLNVFVPFISMSSLVIEVDELDTLESVKSLERQLLQLERKVHGRLLRAGLISSNDLEWNKLCKRWKKPDGFGASLSQMYVKVNCSLTLFHDEIANSAAINVMETSSVGVSLWIAFRIQDLINKLASREEAEAMRNRWIGNVVNDNLNLTAYLNDLIGLNIPLYSLIQRPGQVVYSPSTTTGVVHLVLSLGPRIVQHAWNSSVSLPAFRAAVHTFGEDIVRRNNSAAATRFVLPVLRMQHEGLPLQLEQEVAIRVELAHRDPQTFQLLQGDNETKCNCTQSSCTHLPSECERELDLLCADGMCEPCFLLHSNQPSLIQLLHHLREQNQKLYSASRRANENATTNIQSTSLINPSLSLSLSSSCTASEPVADESDPVVQMESMSTRSQSSLSSHPLSSELAVSDNRMDVDDTLAPLPLSPLNQISNCLPKQMNDLISHTTSSLHPSSSSSSSTSSPRPSFSATTSSLSSNSSTPAVPSLSSSPSLLVTQSQHSSPAVSERHEQQLVDEVEFRSEENTISTSMQVDDIVELLSCSVVVHEDRVKAVKNSDDRVELESSSSSSSLSSSSSSSSSSLSLNCSKTLRIMKNKLSSSFEMEVSNPINSLRLCRSRCSSFVDEVFRPKSFVNEANMCWLNSLMQALFATSYFVMALAPSTIASRARHMLRLCESMFRFFDDSSEGEIDLRSFVSECEWWKEKADNNNQQDASDFFNAMYTKACEDKESECFRSFEFKTQHRLTCTKCGTSETHEVTTCSLLVPLTSEYDDTTTCTATIDTVIDRELHSEVQSKCDHRECGGEQQMKKHDTCFTTLPDVLIIQLKHPLIRVMHSPLILDTLQLSDVNGQVNFVLYAIIVHITSASKKNTFTSGHYVAYIRKNIDEQVSGKQKASYTCLTSSYLHTNSHLLHFIHVHLTVTSSSSLPHFLSSFCFADMVPVRRLKHLHRKLNTNFHSQQKR